MEPFIELALERWAREYNQKHDRELSNWKSKRLPFTHPHLFRGNPLKPTNKQIDARISVTEEGGTAEVLERRAAKGAKASNEELEKIRSWEQWLEDNQHIPAVKTVLKRRSRDAKA